MRFGMTTPVRFGDKISRNGLHRFQVNGLFGGGSIEERGRVRRVRAGRKAAQVHSEEELKSFRDRWMAPQERNPDSDQRSVVERRSQGRKARSWNSRQRIESRRSKNWSDVAQIVRSRQRFSHGACRYFSARSSASDWRGASRYQDHERDGSGLSKAWLLRC